MLASGGSGQGEIRAAGAVLWRPGRRGLEVALVHRPRYDDWSLPKGKRQRGEYTLLTAVREVAEETGTRVVLGRRLPSTHYQNNGRPKVVDYWAARPVAGRHPGFSPNDEVDRLDWLALPAARQRLSYPHDSRVLDDFASGPPETVPVVLLRHAAARVKADWRVTGHDDDLARPLAPSGGQQAVAVAALLRCFAPGQVFSSRAERCVATVWPYAAVAGTSVATEPAFTVDGTGPAETRRRTGEIVGSGLAAVICGHRENLPVILEEACAVLGAKPPDDRPLPLAGFWVLHVGRGRQALASAERHHLVPG
jgi:8-oxo-dGTP pyrophosphatase MutT (NUDIX family)